MNTSPVVFSDDDDFSDDYAIKISDINLDFSEKSGPSSSMEICSTSKREVDPIYLAMIKPKQRADIFTRRQVAPARDSFNPYVEMEFIRPANLASRRPPRPFHTPDSKRRPSTPNSITYHHRRRERQLQEIYGESYKQRDNTVSDVEYNPEIDGHRYLSPNVTPGKTSTADCSTPGRSLRKRRIARWSTIESDSEEEPLDVKQKIRKPVTAKRTPIKPAVSLSSGSPLTVSRNRTPAKRTANNTPSSSRVLLNVTPAATYRKPISKLDVFSTDEDDRLIMDDILTDDNDENVHPSSNKGISPEVPPNAECSPSRKTPTRKCRAKTLSFIKKILELQEPSSNSPEKSRSRKRSNNSLPFTDKVLDEEDEIMLADLLPLQNKRMRIE